MYREQRLVLVYQSFFKLESLKVQIHVSIAIPDCDF